MLKLFLWLKNLRRKKIVLLSVTAVALACGLLIVVASIFNSFITAVENSAATVLGDVMIRPPARFSDYDKLITNLKTLPQVESATAVLQSSGLIHLGTGNVRAVSVWGIDPVGRSDVTGFKSALLLQKQKENKPDFKTDSNYPGAYVGIAVITEPNDITDQYDFASASKFIGSRVVLTTGTVEQQTAQTASQKKLKPRVIGFELKDIVFTGVYILDSKFVYVPIDVLSAKLYPGQPTSADMIQIKLRSGYDPDAAIPAIRGSFDDFAQKNLGWGGYLLSATDVKTAQEEQRAYIAELRKQMAMLLVIFGAASLGAILLIFCIFYMIVVSRQRDIAILKSCGASSFSVASTFVGYGLSIGVVGSLLGLALGWYFLLNINSVEHLIAQLFGLKIWKSSVYLFSTIPNDLNLPAAVWIMIAATLASAIGALLPAFAAARVRPVKILRYE